MSSTEKIPPRQSFGDCLKTFREERGLNRREMADFLGFAPPVYWRYENGRLPDANTIAVIAAKLGVSLDYLLGREPPAEQSTAEQAIGVVREARSHYGSDPEPLPKAGLCRYPANCDLAGKLASLEGQMDEIRTLLISLLAEERRRNNPPNSTEKVGEKAG